MASISVTHSRPYLQFWELLALQPFQSSLPVMKLFLLLLSSPLLSLAQSLCPAGLEQLAGAWAESPDMGCLFADGEEDQKFDTYGKALERCRSLAATALSSSS